MASPPHARTFSPSVGVNLRRCACVRNITEGSCPSSSFKVKYRCPERGAERLEISPSTHTEVKRASRAREAARTNSATPKILGSSRSRSGGRGSARFGSVKSKRPCCDGPSGGLRDDIRDPSPALARRELASQITGGASLDHRA